MQFRKKLYCLQEIERKLRPPAKKGAPPPSASAVAAPPAQQMEMGQAIVMPTKDPLSLIRKVMPVSPRLSEEKGVRKEKPLDFLVQSAALDETTKFRRVYELSDGSQLLSVVRQPELGADVTVQLTCDSPTKMVLHWGVGIGGKDRKWVLPSEQIWPATTTHHNGGMPASVLSYCGQERDSTRFNQS